MDKGPDQARYLAERVILRAKVVRQAIKVAKLWNSREHVDRFDGGI